MKKILFVTNTLCQGGAEHSLITTLNNIDLSNNIVTLLVIQPVLDLKDKIPSEVEVIIGDDNIRYKKSIKHFDMAIRSKFCMFMNSGYCDTFQRKLADLTYIEKRRDIVERYLPSRKFDIVVCNTLSCWATEVACMVSADRRILVYHGSNDTHHEMLNRLIGMYSDVIAVSDEVKERFECWYPQMQGHVVTIENLIEADAILKASNDDYPIDRQDENEFIICSCGRLSEEKGFDMALEAAAMLKGRGFKFKWLFIGDGEERLNLEKLAEQRDISEEIIITGLLNNPFAIIGKCDIYVQPSYEESYGRTIKEAMILGKPIISTNTVGGRLLLDHGNRGILTDISAEEIANGIEILFTNKKIRKSLSNIYTLSDYEYEKRKYQSLWAEILDKK